MRTPKRENKNVGNRYVRIDVELWGHGANLARSGGAKGEWGQGGRGKREGAKEEGAKGEEPFGGSMCT